MDTPICDFVRGYISAGHARLHMPGHKGRAFLGCEALDLTEISGADDLFHAQGIIARSEENAGSLFGCPTLYSTEGSSLCIRAMVYLAMLAGERSEDRPILLAGRNAHKTLLYTAILLDLDVRWLWPEDSSTYHSCPVTPEDVARALDALPRKPIGVYLTSPDYLGNTVDIRGISAVCRSRGVLLLVDNAHGAYLKFLGRHPMELGADLCCDSAHKTLPVLTGGAYLHLSEAIPAEIAARAKEAMALFASTSPSYLILQSLDLANVYLESYAERLRRFLPKVEALRRALTAAGYTLVGDEVLKLAVYTPPCGYTGDELGVWLEEQGIFCEFCDPDHLVLMLTPENSDDDLRRVREALLVLPQRAAIAGCRLVPVRPERVLPPRQAAFAPSVTLPAEQCLGRVFAGANVSCPPAIPILMCGERVDEAALEAFRYYGVETCRVTEE